MQNGGFWMRSLLSQLTKTSTDFKLQTTTESRKLAKGQGLSRGHGLSPECPRQVLGVKRHAHSLNETGNRNLCSLTALFPFCLDTSEPREAWKACVVSWGRSYRTGLCQVHTREKKLQAHGPLRRCLPLLPLCSLSAPHFSGCSTPDCLAFKHIFGSVITPWTEFSSPGLTFITPSFSLCLHAVDFPSATQLQP